VGLAEVIEDRSGDALDDRTVEALSHMRTSGLRLADRVDALLRYARSTREELLVEHVELSEVVGYVEGSLRAQIATRGATVEREEPLGAVSADPALLEIVLQNLVENALKFHAGTPRIRIASSPEGELRRVSVTDDGIGIAPADRDRIFRLFTRAGSDADYAGTGMGLALCRQIVERHGGRIGVDEGPSGGSTFWFTLPAADPPAAP